MKIKLLIALLLACGLNAVSIAQCPDYDGFIFFDSQAQIDYFPIEYPGCTETPAGVDVYIFNGFIGGITNLDGLSQITSIGGNLYIQGNSILMSVDGLNQITSIEGNLYIQDNPALMNVDGLSQITSIGGDLIVADNPLLNQCCALCPLLAADAAVPTVIGGTVGIGNNLNGCNSTTEINACSPCAAACITDLTLTTSEVGNNNYTVSNSIISTDNIAGSENILYDAGNLVELQNGFSATPTCNFSAVIGGCQ